MREGGGEREGKGKDGGQKHRSHNAASNALSLSIASSTRNGIIRKGKRTKRKRKKRVKEQGKSTRKKKNRHVLRWTS